MPTETVYGLVCAADQEGAIQRMAAIKNRPLDKPFALFSPGWDCIAPYLKHPCPSAELLASHFWPGPLTLVIPVMDETPCSYQGTVGVRFPGNDFLQILLQEWGGLLANTSLNRSGESVVWSLDPSNPLLKELDLIIDGGVLPKRAPSTVVNCAIQPPCVLREGDITQSEILEWRNKRNE